MQKKRAGHKIVISIVVQSSTRMNINNGKLHPALYGGEGQLILCTKFDHKKKKDLLMAMLVQMTYLKLMFGGSEKFHV